MKAVSDRIILRPQEAADNIEGIYIPDDSKPKPMRGTVISVGPDCREIKTGDDILFLKGHGAPFEENNLSLLVIKEQDALGIFA